MRFSFIVPDQNVEAVRQVVAEQHPDADTEFAYEVIRGLAEAFLGDMCTKARARLSTLDNAAMRGRCDKRVFSLYDRITKYGMN